MSVRVCTLMWGTAWERYGSIFADTYEKYWDPSIECAVVTDRNLLWKEVQQVQLQDIEAYRSFMDLWKRPELQIHKEGINKKDQWKWDALKWMPQAVAPEAVLVENPHWDDGDVFVWLDADCEFHGPIDERWIEDVLGDADVAAVWRPGLHPDIGFYAMRLGTGTRSALNTFSEVWSNYEVFKFKEWHSAYVWNWCVKTQNLLLNDLNVKGITSHAIPHTILAEKMSHKKGHRKPGGG